jgi:hypothetical protein
VRALREDATWLEFLQTVPCKVDAADRKALRTHGRLSLRRQASLRLQRLLGPLMYRGAAQRCEALFADSHVALAATEALSNLVARSREEDSHGVVQVSTGARLHRPPLPPKRLPARPPARLSRRCSCQAAQTPERRSDARNFSRAPPSRRSAAVTTRAPCPSSSIP